MCYSFSKQRVLSVYAMDSPFEERDLFFGLVSIVILERIFVSNQKRLACATAIKIFNQDKI
ncbi:MAG: hypothetical protein CMK59_06260 [Proteobacteria bacterium]|nr:hypothetical protein [Pseudomonadota bacterium]